MSFRYFWGLQSPFGLWGILGLQGLFGLCGILGLLGLLDFHVVACRVFGSLRVFRVF